MGSQISELDGIEIWDFHRGGGFRGGGDRDRNRAPAGRENDRERLERQRQDRMARLRAENEAEERGDTLAPDEGGDSGNSAAKIHNLPLPDNNSKGKSTTGDNEEEVDDEQNQMMLMMGFGGFGTTKDKAVADNQSSAARGAVQKNKGRKYRQYMNRKGGFNRPLDKMN